MSFADWLGKIQNKPHAQRVRIMWVCVGVSMIFVFLLWLFSLSQIMKQGDSQQIMANDSFQQAKSSYQEAKQEVPGLWQTLKASIFNITEQEDTSEEVEPGGSQGIFKEDAVNQQKPLKLPEN